jgi:murein L,D-transpeptidase YcbB/YkuD
MACSNSTTWIGILFLASMSAAGADAASGFELALRGMLAEREHPYLVAGDLVREHEILVQAYAARDYAPLWIDGGRATPQARGLLHALEAAETRGLSRGDYEVDRVAALLDGLRSSPAQSAQFDLALSVVAVRFVRDLHFGRVTPDAVGFHLEVPRTRLDLADVVGKLAVAESVKAMLGGVEPPFVHYRLLREALARYRELARDADLNRLPPFTGSSLKPGDTYAGAVKLRRLLAALGDLPAEQALKPDLVIGPELVAAIEQFQRRHGLTVDGVIGGNTFAELTRPIAARLRQIELTLERWRWLPHFEEPPIVVNIPQFRLFAFHTRVDREAEIMEMDVIVGRSFAPSRTPVFTEEIRQVVFRPYWDVPYSITTREMLPAIRRNPGYFARNNLEIVRGPGDDAVPVPVTPENIDALATGSLRLRQRPGADNSLGLVKFVLPNAFNVYLHSTPAHQLFEESRRDFSHGCIRVRDPVVLAEHVFHDQPEPWTRERIEQAMQEGPDSQRVTLARPVRVFVVYGTAVASEAGKVQFFDDIYGHDRRLEALLGLEPVK